MTRMLCIALLSIGCSISHAADMRVFGFEFGKPLNLPECQVNHHLSGDDDEQKIYLELQETTCLDLRPRNADGGIWSTVLRFSESDWPQMVTGIPTLLVIQSDAGLLGLSFETDGVQYQDAIFEILRAKYGKPTQFVKSVAQNAFGAAFAVIHARWRMPGLSVVFDGADTAFDSGTVMIDTPRAKKARTAWEADRNKRKPL